MSSLRRLLVIALAFVGVTLGVAVPAQAAPAPPKITQIAVWGDSMTHGWPAYLQELLGIRVLNLGAGGETVQQTKARFDAWVVANPTQLATTGHLCWCGHPNTNRKNHDQDLVVPALQAMAATVPAGLFMPIGLTNGPEQPMGTAGYQIVVEGVNGDMAVAFGNRYAEVRRFLVTDGLSRAGLPATPVDEDNIALDVPPASLRTAGPGNPAHLNDAGRHVTAIRLNDLVRTAGWVATDTRLAAVVTVASSTNPVNTGVLVRMTATVAPAAGSGTVMPTGTIQFSAYGRKLGGPVTLVNGVAVSVPIKALIVGSHPVEAAYSGDVQYAEQTGLVVQVINPAKQGAAGPTVTAAFSL